MISPGLKIRFVAYCLLELCLGHVPTESSEMGIQLENKLIFKSYKSPMFFMGSGFTIIIRISWPYDIFRTNASLGFIQVFFVLASNGL